MSKHKQKTGFTLVELSLSLVFIGILSLAIVLLITNTIGSYQRGLMLNQINTVGMELVADIRGAIQSAPAASGGEKRSYVVKGRRYLPDNSPYGDDDENYPIAGVFCTGSYTYIWNSGYYFTKDYHEDVYSIKINSEASDFYGFRFKYNKIGGDTVKDTMTRRLLKVKDGKAAVCSKVAELMGEGDVPKSNLIDMSGASDEEYSPDDDVVILLKDNSDGDLAIYNLEASAPATYNNVSFYTVSMILGTAQSGMDINATGDYCKEENGGGVLNYCSINKFNFAAQATGGKRNG